MKIEEQDIVKFENGKEYLVVKILNYNDNRYFYFTAVNKEDFPKYIIMKEIKDQNTFAKLGEEEFKIVRSKFAFDFSD